MSDLRTSKLCSFVMVAGLAYSQASGAALTCQQAEANGTKLSISYSDTDEYSRFEFSPVEGEGYWVGVVFEFFGAAPSTPLLQGLAPSIQGEALSEQLTHSFRAHLEEQMPYDAMSGIRSHKLGDRIVTTFDTSIGDHKDLWAVYGQWDDQDFQLFRSMVPVNGPYENSEAMVLEAMHQMIRNCLNHEA